jgi:hypothetical protein
MPGTQELKEAYLFERCLYDSLRMWFILRRATGRQSKIGRQAAHLFSRSLMSYYKTVGEEEFKIRCPEVYEEMRMIMENV